MKTIEEFVDELGQAIFRIEMNLIPVKKRHDGSDLVEECLEDIDEDLEKIKNLRKDLWDLVNHSGKS